VLIGDPRGDGSRIAQTRADHHEGGLREVVAVVDPFGEGNMSRAGAGSAAC